MSKQTVDEAAKAYSEDQNSTFVDYVRVESFVAGAAWERERARELAEALKQISGWPVQPGMSECARKALAEYEGKETLRQENS